ncbi:MAG TPA: acyltransferase [Sphingobium sp.]
MDSRHKPSLSLVSRLLERRQTDSGGDGPAGGGGAFLRPSRLVELDALRGIGALLVMNFHYSTRFQEMFPGAAHVPFHIIGGNYRVLLFFAISGFAIFFSLRHLRHGADFMANRFARLFPAYWGAMLITLTAEHFGHIPSLDIPPLDVLLNFTMLQSFFFVPSVDGAYWTLAIELSFYACTLLLWRTGGLARIETLLLGWLALKWAMFFWNGMPTRVADVLVLQWVPFFGIGMLSYRVWSGQRRWAEQLPAMAALFLTIAGTETPDILLVATIILTCFVAMIEGHLRWLCMRPLTWVGGISYSLYLVHQNVGFVIMLTGNRLGIPPLASYALATVAAFALGTALNRLVERPAGRWLQRRWDQYRAAVPGGSIATA